MAKKTKKSSYSDDSVKVLHGLEGIRERPDMYIGSIPNGVQHLLKEAVDNGIDEFLNGYATKIEVTLDTKTNTVTVSDNGRGMPIGIHPTEKKPTLEILFTKIHAGGKFNDKTAFKVSSGRNGVGIKAISALSKNLSVVSCVTTDFEGSTTGKGKMKFEKGIITEEFKKYKNEKNLHGTTLTFSPDPEIFGEYTNFNSEEIRENLEQRTFSNAGLKIVFTVDGKKEVFYHKDGIHEYLEILTNKFKDISEPFFYNFTDNGNEYEILFKYVNTDTENFFSFVNGIKVGGGTQESGFKMSLTSIMNKFINEKKLLPKDVKEINSDDIRKGLFCVINIRHKNPNFKSQTKDELTNPEILGLVQKMSNQSLSEWIDKYEKTVKFIATRIVKFAKARLNTDKYIQKNIIKASSSGAEYSKKFTDCATTDPARKRVYVAEGDSAANNLIYCRDPEYMAVFGLKGKPKNLYGAETKKIHENDEMNEFELVLFGTNDPKVVSNIENILTYNVIITSDADVDGEHIRCLVINNSWRINPDIVRKGYLYICLTPKYRAVINKKNVFFQDDEELAEYRYNMVKKDIKVKGYNLKKILEFQSDFLKDCKTIINEYSIHEDVFDTILMQLDSFRDLSEIFELNKKTGRLSGFYENHWHDFNFKEVAEVIENLINCYDIPRCISCSINGEEYEDMSVFTILKYINDNYKLKLSYLKGLGENSPEEFKEFMNPETERLIQIKCDSEEELEATLAVFFGNKTEPRKRFVLDNLS